MGLLFLYKLGLSILAWEIPGDLGGETGEGNVCGGKGWDAIESIFFGHSSSNSHNMHGLT